MSKRELPYATLEYREPIVYITFKAEGDIGFKEVWELIEVTQELAGQKPYVVLSDVRDGVNLTPQGKKTAQDPNAAPLHRGTAVVVRNSMMQVAANFFEKIRPLPYPFRAFSDMQQAEAWLKSLSLHKGD